MKEADDDRRLQVNIPRVGEVRGASAYFLRQPLSFFNLLPCLALVLDWIGKPWRTLCTPAQGLTSVALAISQPFSPQAPASSFFPPVSRSFAVAEPFRRV